MFLPELGIGRYPVPPARPYNSQYFAKYRTYAETETGRALTQARIDLVARHYHGLVLDVGIGAGQFVSERPETVGYDVNPAGIAWLKDNSCFVDLYTEGAPALTFWDSLEHIDDPVSAIRQAGQYVFLSIPIFKDAEDILASHHYKKDEHIWYFTDSGLRRWFAEQGFTCVEHNEIECELGRKGVGTYAFRRV